MSHDARALTVDVRHRTGKGVARSLRRGGRIPGILYGCGGDRIALSLDLNTLKRAIDPERRWNTWFNLTVKEEGKGDRSESCIVVDRQIDPLRREVVHVDFLRVDPAKEIDVTVPVEYSGRPVGVKAGGRLKTFRRYVKVAAVPGNIPVKVLIDIAHLEGDETMRIADLKVEGFRLREKPNAPLAFVEVAKIKVEGDDADKDKK
ncbi:MAG TPA: 50S ribosomal protein L25 [Nannocystis exedens]|nr:50S ribosomal protein L25 [Nannocystis exedens]